ncbi:MAG: HD domain-containing protein [Thermoplasmata archaeon]
MTSGFDYRAYANRILPEIAGIKDEKLRKATEDIWAKALEMGGWQDVSDVPFTLLIPNVKTTLVEHTRSVTAMAKAVAESRGDVNIDLVVAAGLCHDVAKLLEYGRKDGKVVKSQFGEYLRHPVSGAGLAMMVGAPVELAHIIAAHADEGEKVRRIPEAIIINKCDFIDFEIAKYRAGMK